MRPMLLVKTRLGKSRIHGLGVFAAQPIRKGQPVWRFVEGFVRPFGLAQPATPLLVEALEQAATVPVATVPESIRALMPRSPLVKR